MQSESSTMEERPAPAQPESEVSEEECAALWKALKELEAKSMKPGDERTS